MKKFSILFIALTLVLTTSCSSDDSKPLSASIIGTWKMISDIEDDDEFVEEGDCDVLYSFTQNTISIEEYAGSDCSELVPNSDNTWAYSIVNNVIIGFDSEEYQGEITNYDYEIIELTETTLKIKYEDEGYVNIITMTRL